MEEDGTWGDHIVLHAAVNCYKLPIRVITSHPDNGEHILQPQTPASTAAEKDCLVLGYIGDYHYVSLVANEVPPEILARGPSAIEAYNMVSLLLKAAGDKHDGRRFLSPDDLLAEAVPGTLELLEDLGRCLDKEYRYGSTKCWKHLAELFNIKPLTYKDFASSQVHSPTEQLFDYLKTHHAELTVKDLKDALSAIHRRDVIEDVLDVHEKSGHLSSSEGTLLSSLFDTGPDIIGEMACRLDRRESGQDNWKHLAGKLHVPRNVFSQFEPCPGENPTEELLDSLCSSRPHLTIKELKDRLDELGLHTAKAVLVANSRKVTETGLLKMLMEDLDVLDKFCSVLNKKEPPRNRTGWELLGHSFEEIKHRDDFAPKQAPPTSPTQNLITRLSGSQPRLTLADFIYGVYGIGRHDVLDVFKPYLPDGCIDQVLRQHSQLSEKAE